MIKDARASDIYGLLHRGASVASVARRLRMSEKTVRKYRDSGRLPSQLDRPQRTYRTRHDPLAEFWPEIEALLKADRRIKPYAILEWLKQKYNQPPEVSRVSDEIRRTLERRVKNWKLRHGVEQEVHFPQMHHPGDVMALDFVNLNNLAVTIGGQPFPHLLFHAVFTYSNWEYVHLCHSESFEALSGGLQDALHCAGGVPRRIRSDSLSAAVKNLSSDKEFTKQYRELLEHYGVAGHRINVRQPQENGDVESSHGHFKDSLDQALRIRGSRDFATVDEYITFTRDHASRRNASRQRKFGEECAALSPLPRQRLATSTSLKVNVKSDSMIHVKRNTYSVSSNYIGLTLEVRIHQDHLELWYNHECRERLPRLFGSGKEWIDFRHVIDSLRCKPGAFINYRYVHHMYPTTRFRMAFDQLQTTTTERSAVKQYLEILYLAKYEGLDQVDEALRSFLANGQPIRAASIREFVQADQRPAPPTAVTVDEPDLSLFDVLLSHKDVYHDETDYCQEFLVAQESPEDGGLSHYDRHAETAGSPEGSASTDVPRTVFGDVGTGVARTLDTHSVPGGVGGQGMPIEEPEPHSAATARCEFATREDLGSIPMVAVAVACDATVRDAASRRLSRPVRQRADFWATRCRENHVTVGAGGSAGQAGTLSTLHHLSDVGTGAAASQTRPAVGASDQETGEVRSADHRRPGLCAAEPRGDGSALHSAGRTVRTGQPTHHVEFGLLQMGTNIQGSYDDCGSDRPAHPSLSDHRAQQGQELPTGRSRTDQVHQGPVNRLAAWFRGINAILHGRSNCR